MKPTIAAFVLSFIMCIQILCAEDRSEHSRQIFNGTNKSKVIPLSQSDYTTIFENVRTKLDGFKSMLEDGSLFVMDISNPETLMKQLDFFKINALPPNYVSLNKNSKITEEYINQQWELKNWNFMVNLSDVEQVLQRVEPRGLLRCFSTTDEYNLIYYYQSEIQKKVKEQNSSSNMMSLDEVKTNLKKTFGLSDVVTIQILNTKSLQIAEDLSSLKNTLTSMYGALTGLKVKETQEEFESCLLSDRNLRRVQLIYREMYKNVLLKLNLTEFLIGVELKEALGYSFEALRDSYRAH